MSTFQAETKEHGRTIAVNGSDKSADLREHDVVCEKGRGDHERWAGNKLYRYLINVNKEIYNDLAPMERSSIIGKIIGTIKQKDGWFVQHDEPSGKWVELNEEKVRKKVSDDLRREVRRRREKRSNSTIFSAKLRAIKEIEEEGELARDILQPVEDPRQTDVLFGPGARRHPGNKTYWRLMKLNLDHYIISPYGARSMISRSIVQGIRDQNGRFLEQDPKSAVWYEISDKRAIEKTSHALSNKKYKTRKRRPEEENPQLNLKASSEEEDEESFCSTLKSGASCTQDGTDNQSRAKKRTKKFRLLQRMGEPIPGDSDDGNENKEAILFAATAEITESPVRSKSPPEKNGPPASPPYPKTQLEERVIVSPNDSRSTLSDDSRDDYHECEDTRGFQRIHKRAPPVPDAPEFGYHSSEIEPRLGRYEGYVDEERYAAERIGYKSSPLSAGGHLQDYAPQVRRYVDRGLHSCPASMEAGYVSPRGQPVPPPFGTPPTRRVIKTRSPSGYWVDEWGVPASRYMEESYPLWH